MTKLIKSLSEWQIIRREIDETIGFVPTMGNLHAGHISLLKRSIRENQQTVLSLFVNPTQFDNPNDFSNYPKTLAADMNIAEKLGVNWILIPEAEEMYPDNYHYHVVETALSHELCGRFRPGHFEGMLTIVLKWLLLVRPVQAYFGEKDFQQLSLVREMVRAFFLEVKIVGCETIRDVNGLALSSRNSRLTADAYQQALQFPKWLQSSLSVHEIRQKLEQLDFVVEYIEEYEGRRYGAVWIEGVRLIDNLKVPLNRLLLHDDT